jgi:hypothetical protein
MATLDAYQDAVARAQFEICQIRQLAKRYQRRYGVAIEDNERLASKWICRREVALALFAQRAECVRLLTEPERGSA